MKNAPIPTREDLFARVEEIAAILNDTAAQSEQLRTLCPQAVDALHGAGLFGLWGPTEIGGYDADLVTQVDVMIEVARADMAACWTMMIGNTVTGVMASNLPEAGFSEVFSTDRLPIAAGSLKPSGSARPEEGGFLATGKWGFGSGIHHSSWIVANCLVDRADKPGEAIALAIPIGEVDVFDDWHVSGLCGSGSSSYSVSSVFVPTSRVMKAPLRGSVRTGNPGPRLPLEHASVSLGGARRALDEVAGMAAEKYRLTESQSVADKQAFQVELGKLNAQWTTLRAGVRECAEALDSAYQAGIGTVGPAAIKLRAVCALATQRSLDIGGRAFRHAGAGAVLDTNVLQRIHRDLTVSAQHFMVSDAAYESYGKSLLAAARS